ncbi:MAG: hypothetical protein J07HQW2_03130 [Haloquadratum walsbyi J07HQW2]|uniref:Uncharacterized protein n=1 Tax=Haloquadratum walsbyi J07HQW2 TaxID=1238425 RepID=U1NIB3_9EURY|nr:MAG: hypothetical protein J07HQW2_03130 [Haloquadratum walsbyi J07HQW2]
MLTDSEETHYLASQCGECLLDYTTLTPKDQETKPDSY